VNEGWLTLKEAADTLGLSVETVKKQVKRRSLNAEKRGRDLFVTPTELERYKAESLGQRGRRKQAEQSSGE